MFLVFEPGIGRKPLKTGDASAMKSLLLRNAGMPHVNICKQNTDQLQRKTRVTWWIFSLLFFSLNGMESYVTV